LAGKSNSVGAQPKFAEASAMSLTRKAPAAAKQDGKPKRQNLVQALAERDTELAEARRENTRLFDEVQAKTRDLSEALVHQTASGNILKVIASSPTKVAPALQAIVESACEVCDAYDAAVILREGDHVRFSAHCGPIPIGLETWPLSRGWVGGRAIVDKVPVHVADLQLAGEEFPDGRDFALRMGYRTILAAPLLREGESVGAIVVRRKEAHPFSDKQIELLRSFADQAVIAIGNVRLFDEVQAKTRDLEESLTQQTATADVLKAISRSAFDLQTVFESLISTAVRLCSAKQGVIFRRQGEIYRYAASHMLVDPAYRAHEQMAQIKTGRGTLIGRVALENRAVQISDAWTDSEYAEKDEVRHADVRAMLGVPLMRDGEMIGAFALGRAEPVPFSQRQVDLVATFADQAVIAIENARLFDEVQAKTRDVEEALQQQTATADVLKVISRSAFDLQAVLTTLAESARELCGASFATLFMLDRDGDEMRLRAESGCTPEIVAFLRAHPIKAGRETFTGRVMLSGEAVHLPDVLADPEYDFGDAPRIGDYRALLGVPLLRDGQVEGVFALARPEPTPFTARQIEMVRAFADQAVIAIENSRLFEEVQARTRELAASLDDLRKAQDRLIQSEKLASLGQLTAGIAHEIKNPLNFINNYAALSRELIDELAEATKNDAANGAAQGEADELIGAIGGNLDKIVQHGKRADSIVKNMLLHSREGSGERSKTNVNAMVEEALNLAYHGARAEKPGFNVTIVKSLDPNAGLAEVYAQEMTRVLLNLISNGFYATSKRKQSARNGAYEPTISASTRDLGGKVEIAIRDNGTGIPDEVKAKMFNPFFTTKPAGEGTGLGLSLSHDIVVKQHGGLIEVLTEPDAFTEFKIMLPRGAAVRS
jgi:GAF domain-containing protein